MNKLRKILALGGLFLVTNQVFALSLKYDSLTYQPEGVKVNSGVQEYAISPFEKDKILFLKKGKKSVEVYEGTVDVATGNVKGCKRNKNLTELAPEGTIAFDESGKTIYFTKSTKKASVLYESSYKDKQWTKPKKVVIATRDIPRAYGDFVADAGWRFKATEKVGDIYNPFVSKDGKTIYFSSDMANEGTRGGRDIWCIEKSGKSWNYPTNISQNINSLADEDYAFVDGDKLYFSRKENGSNKLYVAKKETDNWSNPELLDERYNGDGDNFNLIVKNDNPLFVSTRTPKNSWDIFYLHYEKPKEVQIDTVPESLPEPPMEEQIKKQREYRYVMFQFDYDKRDFKEEYRQDLNDLLETMKDFPETTRFMITGHTDARGTDAYNDALSLKRANAIKEQLVEAGFDANRLETQGKGKRELLIKNPQTEEEHYKNRRVEVTIIMENEQ